MTGAGLPMPPDSTRVVSLVLEAIAGGRPLREVLNTIASGLESIVDGWRVSILLVSPDGQTLQHGCGPGLPPEYLASIDGLQVGPATGSCGTAVHRRDTVIVEDIATNLLWEGFRHLVEPFGLRACWSVPVVDARGVVLATFAVYHFQPARPTQEQLALIERFAHLVLVALQHDRTQRELMASEARFRSVFENAAFGLAVADASGRFVHVNAAFQEMLGYDESELRQRRIADITFPEDFPENQRLLDELLADQRTSFVLEKRFVSRDGRVFPARITVSGRRDADGRVIESIAIAEDISQQRAAQAAREQQERLMRMASRVGQLGAWSLDVPAYTMHLSEEALAIRGYPAGSTPSALELATQFEEEFLPRLQNAARACISQGAPFDEEGRLTTAAGEQRWVRTIGEAVRDEGGAIVRLQGAMQDVTDRKQLEQQSLRSQRLESIGTLAGGIAHDLNNVLTPIAMGVSLLKANEADPGRAQLLSMIESSAGRAADMVRQVLSFARGVEGQRTTASPATLLTEAASLLADTLPKQIRLELDAPDDVWPVQVDETQMHQVLVNLCVNARDAMPRGGTLTLRAANLIVDGRAQRQALAPGRYVRLQVEDTGEGIAPDVLDKIFDPFFTTKPTGLGTGLGLSTSLGLVRGHGGRIDVSSIQGRGSRFDVTLPAADAAQCPSDTPVEVAQGRHGKGTVLIVDDESAVRLVSRHVLESVGYAVLEASDGEEAIDVLARCDGRVALVLTDMMMPGMDGPALARQVRARWPRVPVVGMSGLGAAERFNTETLGVRAFLPKPFTPDSLRAALDAALSGTGPH